jgi:hypothetical protein
MRPSSDAKRTPRATADHVVSKILYLRQHYHCGAGRIADYLKRFHEVTVASENSMAPDESPESRRLSIV